MRQVPRTMSANVITIIVSNNDFKIFSAVNQCVLHMYDTTPVEPVPPRVVLFNCFRGEVGNITVNLSGFEFNKRLEESKSGRYSIKNTIGRSGVTRLMIFGMDKTKSNTYGAHHG